MKHVLIGLSCILLFLGQAVADETQSSDGHSHDDSHHDAIAVDFPTSCPSVQHDFNVAVALMHNMTYAVARSKFEQMIQKDPNCGMAHWGVGMTYIHPLWGDNPSAEIMADGSARVAAARASTLSQRERAYVEALAAYYDNAGLELYERLKVFAKAIKDVHLAYPDDLEAKAFHAVTHLSTMTPGSVDLDVINHVSKMAFEVLSEDADHPGGHHYSIHAFDYPGLAHRAVEVAKNYAKLAPDNPHALHMPTHIFTRLGMWEASITLNERSAAAAKAQPHGDAVSLHYPHALDYMLYGYLQSGQEGKAREVVEAIADIQMPIQVHPASAYHLASAQARWTLERHDWAAAAATSPRTPADFPWDKFPQFEALAQFGVAIGAARSGDTQKAKAAIGRLQTLENATGHSYWKKQVKVMRLAAQAWLAEAEGDRATAAARMQQSAELEASMSKHPITPGEILPAGELLGDLMMLHGKPNEALAAYQSALDRSPNRLNSLYGAGKAAEALGETDKAKGYYATLVEVCAKADTDREGLAHARRFIKG